MNFREYKIGARLFGMCLGGSMCITLFMPAFDFRSATSTETALDKQLSAGWETGWNIYDPLMRGANKPLKVMVKADPKSGAALAAPTYAYVYKKGVPAPNAYRHPDNLGKSVQDLSMSKGKLGEFGADGTVYLIKKDGNTPYIENATATMGWTADAVLSKAADADIEKVGAGKTLFVREGCWWCHTLLPEQTQDWQVFGAPPFLGDFNGESPTAFGSDRKAPDLLHVGSRNSSKEWMMLHFFNPRLVQPHSIMPRFDYMWGDVDDKGQKIDYNKWRAEYDEYHAGKRVDAPEVPGYAKDSEIRALIDFMLSLK